MTIHLNYMGYPLCDAPSGSLTRGLNVADCVECLREYARVLMSRISNLEERYEFLEREAEHRDDCVTIAEKNIDVIATARGVVEKMRALEQALDDYDEQREARLDAGEE